MPRRVTLTPSAEAAIRGVHPDTKRRIRAAIDAVREAPDIGEPLEQTLTSFRKIVGGSWRIVYREESRAILVHAIGRRATVYAELMDRLARSIEEPAPRRRTAVVSRAPRRTARSR